MAKRSSWKNERASVSRRGAKRAQSNKFSGSDTTRRPPAGSRSRVWVAGYTRADGTEVAGHFRKVNGGGANGRSGAGRTSRGASRSRSR
jgi:hypothetical protein